jgi:hypothetical protein
VGRPDEPAPGAGLPAVTRGQGECASVERRRPGLSVSRDSDGSQEAIRPVRPSTVTVPRWAVAFLVVPMVIVWSRASVEPIQYLHIPA